MSTTLQMQDCPDCDGCGWYEGGYSLQSQCLTCGGSGQVADVEPARPERPGDIVELGSLRLRLLRHAAMKLAHPDEPYLLGETCPMCYIAERLDNQELVLLWLCGGINWSISRHDPNYERHRQEAGV